MRIAVIGADGFIVYRPRRRSLLSWTRELSYLSHSFCRSLRPTGRPKLIGCSGAGVGVTRHREPAAVSEQAVEPAADIALGDVAAAHHEAQ